MVRPRLGFDTQPNYVYIFCLGESLEPIFTRYGFEFYDFSNSIAIGSSDKEMIDGFHGSEKTFLRLFIDMLQRGSFLNGYADKRELENLLNNSRSDYAILEESI